MGFAVTPFDRTVACGPLQGAAYWATTCDGKNVRVAAWRPEDQTLGTVLLFQGV